MDEVTALRRRLAEYESLLEIGVQLAGSLDPEQVLEVALSRAEEMCQAETSSIWELDRERQELFFHKVRGKARREIRRRRIALGQGIVGSVAQTRVPEVVNDVTTDERWAGDAAASFRTRAILTVPLEAHGRVVGVLQLLNPNGKKAFSEDDLRCMKLLAGPLAYALDNARLYAAQKRQYLDTVTALAQAVEKRDPYTGDHISRVVHYSLLLGSEMKLAREELEDLRLAATLHDIGKIGVPDEILGKPAPLDAGEEAVMRRHTLDGFEIVSRVRQLHHVLAGVRSHHERLDGGGYPDALTEEQIPTPARIIAVADTYDAMTTNRPYREALSDEDAAAEIIRGSGTQFCPRVVEAFRGLFERGDFNIAAGEQLLASLFEDQPRG